MGQFEPFLYFLRLTFGINLLCKSVVKTKTLNNDNNNNNNNNNNPSRSLVFDAYEINTQRKRLC